MILIKIGGGKAINYENICQDIAELSKHHTFVIVHGANALRDEVAVKMNYRTKKIKSPSGIESTYTDRQALDIFLMSYAGLMNKKLVAIFQKHGVNAVGMTGADGQLWKARWKKHLVVKSGTKEKLIQGSLTGRVESVNVKLLSLLVSHGYTPVICPPAISYEGELVNTDNDWASAVMAGALHIRKMVSLFEAPGMLENFKDEKSLIPKISYDELDGYLVNAQGGMKKKILGAKKALESGVEYMYWSDGRVNEPVKKALQGNGTVIYK